MPEPKHLPIQQPDWRDQIWSTLDREWDIIIIGGGITGAGILLEAAHCGLSCLMVESRDFASGTSSRSSKLVHGGLRYLKSAQPKITVESVSEREKLLREGKGLINRLGFLHANLQGDRMPGWVFGLGLVVYDLIARQWSHKHYDPEDIRELCPSLTTSSLIGGYRYFDAQTDDARLVFRLIREAISFGATAINYCEVIDLLHNNDGQICGVHLQDQAPDSHHRTLEVRAGVVVNATGAWADVLRSKLHKKPRLRPLRGSHLIFSQQRIPLTRAISFMHPEDGRPVYVIPWEGVILLGTTDVDHSQAMDGNPCISVHEVDYLLSAARHVFPELTLNTKDVISTFSGIRPVVNTGKANPSSESREHVIWMENGMLTVSGGKLTTFRLMARDAMRLILNKKSLLPNREKRERIFQPISDESNINLQGFKFKPAECLRLLGRYGNDISLLCRQLYPGKPERIPETPYLWEELRWAAASEMIVHLEDIMLRRLRLGLLLPGGGIDHLNDIRHIVLPVLGWNEDRWQHEVQAYSKLWQRFYSLPTISV